jgi:hypothetical protein
VRIFWVDILTFDGFFGAKFDILKPRWLPTLGLTDEGQYSVEENVAL